VWRCGFAGGLGVAHPAGTPRGAMAVAPGKVGWRGSHRRRPAAAERRKWPGATAFQGGGGAPVGGEGVDVSYSWRRRRGMSGGRRWRATMVGGGGGSSPKGTVSGGGSFTSGDVDMPPAVGRGQEARGVKWCSWCACE
jgi:hypothetical protein